MGDYYLDGPVLLKNGISLVGIVSEDSPFNTAFFVHGSGTGADGVIIADGVSGALVSIYPVLLYSLNHWFGRCRLVVVAR